jgi:hypothetical protein
LKISKGKSESVYLRRTDNTMAKKKVQKNKQRSKKHTYKTKDRVTRTPVKTEVELMCSGRVSSSCSTSGTRRVNLGTNPVISREWGKNWEVLTTSGTYPWSLSNNFISIRHMWLVYHPPHRRNDVKNYSEKYVNYFIFLNASIK